MTISEQDFLQAAFQSVARETPFSLTLLELMFGPGLRKDGRQVIRVGKRFSKVLTGEAVFWPASHERPFNVIHVGPVKRSDVDGVYPRKSYLVVSDQVAVSGVIDAVLDGFRKLPKRGTGFESGKAWHTVVVLSVQDGEERTTYFETSLTARCGSQGGFSLRDPSVDDEESRTRLRDFYARRLTMFHGTSWQSAFYMPDLHDDLTRDLPADWKLSQDAITAELSPDVSLSFGRDSRIRLEFKDDVVTNPYISFRQELVRDLQAAVKKCVDLVTHGGGCGLNLNLQSARTPISAQQLSELINQLPPWMIKLFKVAILENQKVSELNHAFYQQNVEVSRDRLDRIRQTLDLLTDPHE